MILSWNNIVSGQGLRIQELNQTSRLSKSRITRVINIFFFLEERNNRVRATVSRLPSAQHNSLTCAEATTRQATEGQILFLELVTPRQ